jgi:hypothetical protein
MSDPINLISEKFRELLLGWGLAPGLVQLISSAIGAIVVCMVAGA